MASTIEQLKNRAHLQANLQKHHSALETIKQVIGYGHGWGASDGSDLIGLDPVDDYDEYDDVEVDGLQTLLSQLAMQRRLKGGGLAGGGRSRLAGGLGGGGYRNLALRFQAPANALRNAQETSAAIEKNNANALIEHSKVKNKQEELKDHPWCDTAGFGLFAFIQRQILSSINLTPFNGLNRFEVSHEGLTIFQPFRAVSKRTVSYQDLLERNVVLSINPPAYFDLMLGLFGQFRWGRDIPSPWGQLVVDEPGSGRIVGTTVVFWPAEKQKTIEELLKQLHDANRPLHERLQEERDVASFLIGYSVDEWSERLEQWMSGESVPDEYLHILYIPPDSEQKKDKKSKSNWPKRAGCILAILFLVGFVILRPIWWVVAFVWRRISLFLPKPLRFFVD